jgi:hypothetical protein
LYYAAFVAIFAGTPEHFWELAGQIVARSGSMPAAMRSTAAQEPPPARLNGRAAPSMLSASG